MTIEHLHTHVPYVCICTHAHMWVYVHMYICMYMYTCTYICISDGMRTRMRLEFACTVHPSVAFCIWGGFRW